MEEHKIDISRIQETLQRKRYDWEQLQHILLPWRKPERNGNEQRKKIKGGVAIAIYKIYAENIYRINRIDKKNYGNKIYNWGFNQKSFHHQHI